MQNLKDKICLNNKIDLSSLYYITRYIKNQVFIIALFLYLLYYI